MKNNFVKFIDANEVFCKDCNLKDTNNCKYCDVHSMPAVDVVPVDEIQKLRDELFGVHEIEFKGFSKINQLITQYSTYKCDVFNTDEVSE